MKTTDLKIFLVEFGKPDLNNFSFDKTADPVIVLARDFEEASKKAFIYAEEQINKELSKSVLDSNGSLIINDEETLLTVKSVKMISEKVII